MSAAQGKDLLLKPETAQRWRELSRGEKVVPRGKQALPQGKQAEHRPIRGGTQWVTASYLLWPSKNSAAAVAINGGSAFDACNAVFEAVK